MLHHDAWAGDPLGCYRVGQRQRGGSVRGNRGAKHTVGRLSQPSQPSLNPLASHPLVAAGGRAMMLRPWFSCTCLAFWVLLNQV